MQIPRVRFRYATENEEAMRIFAFKEKLSFPENSSTKSCYNIVIPEELTKKLLASNSFEEVKEDIIFFVRKNIPKGDREELKKAVEFWNEVSKSYIRELCLLTDNELFFEEYDCIIIRSVVGHYIENSNKVYSNIDFGYKACIAICCEEILHLHYWQILKKLFNLNKKSLTKRYGIIPWKLSEIIPEYILINNPEFEPFGFNKWNRALSYPWIIKMKEITDKMWNQRTNFKDFLLKMHNRFNCPLERIA